MIRHSETTEVHGRPASFRLWTTPDTLPSRAAQTAFLASQTFLELHLTRWPIRATVELLPPQHNISDGSALGHGTRLPHTLRRLGPRTASGRCLPRRLRTGAVTSMHLRGLRAVVWISSTGHLELEVAIILVVDLPLLPSDHDHNFRHRTAFASSPWNLSWSTLTSPP